MGPHRYLCMGVEEKVEEVLLLFEDVEKEAGVGAWLCVASLGEAVAVRSRF